MAVMISDDGTLVLGWCTMLSRGWTRMGSVVSVRGFHGGRGVWGKSVAELEEKFAGERPAHQYMGAHQRVGQGLECGVEGDVDAYLAPAVELELVPYVEGKGPFPMSMYGFVSEVWKSAPPESVLDTVQDVLATEAGSSLLGWDFISNAMVESGTPVAADVIRMMEANVVEMAQAKDSDSAEAAVAEAVQAVCAFALSRRDSLVSIPNWPLTASYSDSELASLMAKTSEAPLPMSVTKAHVVEIERFRNDDTLVQFLARTSIDRMRAEWGAWHATSDPAYVRAMVECASLWVPFAHYTLQAVNDPSFTPDEYKDVVNVKSSRFMLAKGSVLVLIEEGRRKPWLRTDLAALLDKGVLSDRERRVVNLVLTELEVSNDQ